MGTTPAKRKMTTPNIGEEAQEQSPAVDEEQSPTTNWNVSIEPDTLECGVCFSHFETPIYQCKNGHPACVGCCTTLEKTCHVCSEPTGDIRCRPLEKVLEGMTMPCTYMKSGCKQTVRYVEKRSHEESCSYAPAHCPIHGCSYSGLQLYDHIREEHNTDIPYISISNDSNTTVSIHKNEPFRVLLHPVDGRVFLLLNSAHIPQGRSLSVVCIGPPPRSDHGLECKMEVSANPVTLSLSAQVPCVRQWTKKYRAEGFLFVPDAYWNHLSQSVSVAVGVKLLFK